MLFTIPVAYSSLNKLEKYNKYKELTRGAFGSVLLLCGALGLMACNNSNFASNPAVKTPSAAPTTSNTNPNPPANPISNVCNQNLAIALVMDVSGSMKDSAYPGSSANAAWNSFISGMGGGNTNGATSNSPSKMSVDIDTAQKFVGQVTNPSDMFGLVTFSDQAKIVSPMSSDKSAIQNAIGQLTPQDNTNITDGLNQGAMLLAGVPAGYTKILLLISDGQNNGPGDPLTAATRIKQSGVLVITLGFMADSGQAAMQAMATDASDNFNSTDSASFISNFNAIAQKLCI